MVHKTDSIFAVAEQSKANETKGDKWSIDALLDCGRWGAYHVGLMGTESVVPGRLRYSLPQMQVPLRDGLLRHLFILQCYQVGSGRLHPLCVPVTCDKEALIVKEKRMKLE
jgi:hypothetical protein